ncbi:hypothetical protein ACFFIY_04190 [Bhargavaea ullalensis]|uniref:Cell division protein FtsL n=1 Tax=Bhargavaea ullalensis TaxID=1265685 RepID=A0ABV2GEL1_9BACL
MLWIIIIVAIGATIPVSAIITDHQRQMTKLKAGLVREEIELEQLKQQNFIAETEQMKLELEKMKLDYTADHVLPMPEKKRKEESPKII